MRTRCPVFHELKRARRTRPALPESDATATAVAVTDAAEQQQDDEEQQQDGQHARIKSPPSAAVAFGSAGAELDVESELVLCAVAAPGPKNAAPTPIPPSSDPATSATATGFFMGTTVEGVSESQVRMRAESAYRGVQSATTL